MSGCPDPEGAYNDFNGRLPPAIDAPPGSNIDASSFEMIPDVTGTFLIGLTNKLLNDQGKPPILFLSTQTVENSGGTYRVSLSFQPLDKDTRLPVGTAAVFPSVEVSQTGEFSIALGSMLTIPAAANTLLAADIVADSVVVTGRIFSADNHCGTLAGNVTAPIALDLAAQMTTYGAIRVTGTSPPFPPEESKCRTSSAADAGASDAP